MSEQKNIIEEDEIDLVELVKTIWAGRRLIAKITSVFVVLGLIIAFTSKVEYEATCKLLPMKQSAVKSGFGGLSGLAGLAGLNLDLGIGGDLPPNLYPEIINSLPNQLIIINDTLDFELKKLRTTPLDYFQNHQNKPTLLGQVVKYTIGLPRLIKSWYSPDKPLISKHNESKILRFTNKEWGILQGFKNRIKINEDSDLGLINIKVEMPDPLAAAQLANNIVDLMTNKIIEYKTNSVKNNLLYIQKAYNEAEVKFENIQNKLAVASDRNVNIKSASANIQLQTLQNQYNLAFEVYKGLALQLEQAKIKLKKETPVFTVLEPVRIPSDKSKPKRATILMLFTFAGLFISILIVLFKSKR